MRNAFVTTTTAVVASDPTTNFHDNPFCLHNGHMFYDYVFYDDYDNSGGDVCCVEENFMSCHQSIIFFQFFSLKNTYFVIHFHITINVLRLFTNISTFF